MGDPDRWIKLEELVGDAGEEQDRPIESYAAELRIMAVLLETVRAGAGGAFSLDIFV
jgi:hypothetical protein